MSELHTSQEAAPLVGPDGLGLCCCHGHLDGLTLEEMAALGAKVMARGLCSTCYSRGSEQGWLADYPRVTRRTADLVDEYVWLRPSGLSGRERVRMAAGRLGVSVGALEVALRRSGVKP
jgi:hypothetical protein